MFYIFQKSKVFSPLKTTLLSGKRISTWPIAPNRKDANWAEVSGRQAGLAPRMINSPGGGYPPHWKIFSAEGIFRREVCILPTADC